MNPTHYTFVVTEAQANLILQTLARPLDGAMPVIQELQRQATEQQKTASPVPDIPVPGPHLAEATG